MVITLFLLHEGLQHITTSSSSSQAVKENL
jgi:hypothetical protein